MAKISEAIKKGIHKRKYVRTKKGTARHWTYVLIAAEEKLPLIAEGMDKAVKSKKKIKYSNTKKGNAKLYDAVKKKNFDCSRLTKKTTTNCCNLVSVACRYAGIPTPRKSNSRTLPSKWKKYGFTVIKFKKGMPLRRGYILVDTEKPKVHTAVYMG